MTSINTGNYSLLIVGIITGIIAFFVLVKNPKKNLNLTFFTFAIGGAIWISGIALISITGNFFFDKVINYGGLIFVIGFFLLAKAIPVAMKFNVNPFLLYLPVCIDAFYIIPRSLINSDMYQNEHGQLTPIPGPYIIPHSLITVAFTIFGIMILTHKFRHSHGREKLQIKYLFLGTAIFMSTSVICDAFLPAFGITSLNLLGPLSAPIFVGIIAYSIMRHELLDIRVVIQRGLIYALLFGIIICCYWVVLNLISIFIDQTSNLAIFFTSSVTMSVGVLTVPIIEKYFRKKTDKIFFKGKYDYAEALHELSVIAYSSVRFEDLIEKIENAISRIFRNKSVKVIFNNVRKEKTGVPSSYVEMPCKSTLYIPIELENKEIGSIFCGPKRSGDYYTHEDIKLLKTFTYHAATALSRAGLYKEVKRHAKNLESKVQERTRDLKESQDKQKQMIVDISHNLQTPLTIFQTKIEQLKKNYPFDEAITGFEKSLNDLSEFIYKLLALSKLENKIAPTETTKINLSEVVKEIAEEVNVIADHKKIVLKIKITDNLYIKANEKEIQEAFLNIVSNAFKYLKVDGKREVALHLQKEKDKILFSVTDTGIGIPQSDCKHIFERFYRANKSAESGTGIGLAITKKIIDQCGGSIWCESVEHLGTTFYVELQEAK
jgi:signal transduction histidine kinase